MAIFVYPQNQFAHGGEMVVYLIDKCMNVITADHNFSEINNPIGDLLRVLNVKDVLPSNVLNETKPKKENKRKELLNQLYSLYATEQDNKNRINYYRYIRVHHPAALSKEEDYYKYKDEYRTAKLPENIKYSPLIKKGDYLWWGRFSHLKGEEGIECLRTMISEVRDIKNRKGNIISYILGASGKLSHE